MKRIATWGWRAATIGYVVFAALFTLLPIRIHRGLLQLDINELINPRAVARAAMIGAGAAAIMLALMTWRRRRDWRSRLSWPVVAWLAICLGGLATLVLLSQPPRLLARHGLTTVAEFSEDFDMRHMVAYVGFAAVAAFGWRDRLSLPAIGALLLAYGFVLEVAQEFVPSRNFRIRDLISNGLGVSLGLSWVYLHDLLHDRTKRVTRREPGRAAGHAGPSAQPRQP
jgi:VanZ family protein